MPSFKTHCRISELRTGKRFEALHRWMDEYQKEMGVNHREKRHSLNDIEEVRKIWGNESVIEFLAHIVTDFKSTKNKLEKLVNKLKADNRQL